MWMWEGKVSVHGFNNRRGNGGERDLRPRPRFRLRPPTLPVEQKKLRRSGARARHGEPLRHFFARKAKRERGGRAEAGDEGGNHGQTLCRQAPRHRTGEPLCGPPVQDASPGRAVSLARGLRAEEEEDEEEEAA
ncbi:unnamed protein product [Prorocentrum cordatum]|uniref:Uncharacterized protein n=1 Tax=Prorocentrum cordatum TaxID=2364126 RepID=A0ABN9W689_9DINO|nr:unnamed protein product [Polarella glacialis]